MPDNNKNIVRDRTLILRVLVPGLHTSLNDKINSKSSSQDDTNNNSTSSSLQQSSSNSRTMHLSNTTNSNITGSAADQILNLDGVTCLPSKSGSTLWHFRCDGATYPARLVNLPCPVEVHKTHDHANYHKAADVGQMLIVYEDDYAMEEAENDRGYKIDGFPSYYHSGLTPPMNRVVQRRYLSRFEERDTKPIPPPKSQVAEVEKDLQGLIAKLSVKQKKGKKGGSSSSKTSSSTTKIIEEVEEEIVDYEDWMGEGGVFTVDDAKMHPEWFLTKAELKEIEAAKRSVEEEKLRKEQEAIEAARDKEEQERKKQEAKAEKKKKKKDKKKKREEEAALAAAAVPDKKTPTEDMDEVTAAAMTINEGLEGDEDFLFGVGGDDMFDFENEDITDLLS